MSWNATIFLNSLLEPLRASQFLPRRRRLHRYRRFHLNRACRRALQTLRPRSWDRMRSIASSPNKYAGIIMGTGITMGGTITIGVAGIITIGIITTGITAIGDQ
jgi:hypothetical protein